MFTLALTTAALISSVTALPAAYNTMHQRDVSEIVIGVALPVLYQTQTQLVVLDGQVATYEGVDGKKTATGLTTVLAQGPTSTSWTTSISGTITKGDGGNSAAATTSIVTSAWNQLPLNQQYRCDPDDKNSRDYCQKVNAAGDACAQDGWTAQSCGAAYQCASGPVRDDPRLKDGHTISSQYAECYPDSYFK
ncbi:hypothetical protein EMMF5_005077 [Cystobasidiomycetes sp. EMM_F5]